MTRNGIVHLDGWSRKIFSSFEGFVRLDFYPLGLLSYGAFVPIYGFSLSTHETAWRECWFSTPVSCDHMTRNDIVHLDSWSRKIFSSFGGFVRLDFYPLGLLSYGAFVPFWLFSVHPRRMMRMLIVHTCIMWSRMLIVHTWFLSFGAVVLWCFCSFWLSSVHPRDWMTRMLIVHTWSCTLMVGVVKYFHLLGVLSALIFILWGCCPMVLLSILAFLCPPTCPHDENVYCPHLHHVITWPEMGSCNLMV